MDIIIDDDDMYQEFVTPFTQYIKSYCNIQYIKENLDKFIELINNDIPLTQMLCNILKVTSIEENMKELYE